jgi:ribonuclease HI
MEKEKTGRSLKSKPILFRGPQNYNQTKINSFFVNSQSCSDSNNKDVGLNSINNNVFYKESESKSNESLRSKKDDDTCALFKHSECLFSKANRSLDYYFGSSTGGKNVSIPLLDNLDLFFNKKINTNNITTGYPEYESDNKITRPLPQACAEAGAESCAEAGAESCAEAEAKAEGGDESCAEAEAEAEAGAESCAEAGAESCAEAEAEAEGGGNRCKSKSSDVWEKCMFIKPGVRENIAVNKRQQIGCGILKSAYRKGKSEDFFPDYYVYTDGSCVNNGRANAQAGIGVYFGENDSRNVSKRVEGKQSNNTAELGAVIAAFAIIKKDLYEGRKVGIVSDSEYVLKCVGSYGERCSKEGWAKDIPNKEMVMVVYTLADDWRHCTRFFHVRSHTNQGDVHSLGNECADRLANKAIGRDAQVTKNYLKKIYMNVPYSEKDCAKRLGASWDIKKKKWFIYNNNPNICILMEKYCNKT